MKIGNSLIKIDRLADYIPIVSSLSNLFDIFCKKIFIPILQKTNSEILKNRYFCYINQKDLFRCAILLIPIVGNLIIYIQDFLSEEGIAHRKALNDTSKSKALRVLNLSEDDIYSLEKVTKAYTALKKQYTDRITKLSSMPIVSPLKGKFLELLYNVEVSYRTVVFLNSLQVSR